MILELLLKPYRTWNWSPTHTGLTNNTAKIRIQDCTWVSQYEPRNDTQIFPGPATDVTKLTLTWTVWQGPRLKCAANRLWFSSPMVSIESQLLDDNRYSNSVVIYFIHDIKRRRSPYPSSPLHSAQYTWHCFARLQQTRDARPFSRLRWHDLRSTPLHTATCRWSGISKRTPLLRCLRVL